MTGRVAAAEEEEEEENPCNLQININDEQTFFLNQRILCAFSGRLRKVMKKNRQNYSGIVRQIEIQEFPGGPNGFELVSRFCYGNGGIKLTPSNASLLHCGAIFLGMTEKVSPCNLMQQTDAFLQGMFYWSWNDVLVCLRSCETFYSYADLCGLIDRLISSLLAKIAQNTDITSLLGSSSSSTTNSDPDSPSPNSPLHHYNFSSSASCMFRLSCSAKNNTDFVATNTKPSAAAAAAGWSPPSKAWWFDDLATLSPRVIEKVIKSLGSYGADNNSLLLTKFLLHYLKSESALQSQSAHNSVNNYPKSDYSGLADTVAYGVLFLGKTTKSTSPTPLFSCRSLFSILRLVSAFGLSKECRAGLRKLIGGMLDQAKLDDLLVSGAISTTTTTHHDHVHHHHDACSGNDGRYGCERAGSDSCVYDVNLVLRLIRVFVGKINNAHKEDRPILSNSQLQRLKMVGWLIDQYLGEISPDQNLNISKFMAVANSLPDSARDCFDGVYRAIDIYLQSHPNLSMEERSRLCGCLNYEKLSLGACKDLAKNPRIPPRVAVQALASQQANLPHNEYEDVSIESVTSTTNSYNGRRSRKGIKQQQQQQIVLYDCSYKQNGGRDYHQYEVNDGNDDEEEEDDDMGVDVQRMRWRVGELEKLCWEMKGQMSKLVGHRSIEGLPQDQGRGSPRFC